MKAAFFDLENEEISIITQRCKNAGIDIVTISTDPLDSTTIEAAKDAEILSVFLSKVDQSIIEKLPHVKLINARATGFDHIDIEFAKKKDIAVISIPSYCEQSVAEYAMGLILMLSRKLSITFVQSLFGTFDRKTIRGNDLAGKTLGIIGTGKIGQRLVKIASGFDVKILCHDIKPNTEITTRYKAEYVSLETLFKNSDIISIHVPYTKDTHHLINFDTLKLLKKGILLVNTARGPIIDTSAIRQGLVDKIFGGVALDTFEADEIWIERKHIVEKAKLLPSAKDLKKAFESFYLLTFKNVILSPHNAFNTHESIQKMIDISLADIISFNQTGNCQHRIV